MADIRQDIEAILERCKSDIATNMETQGVNASGRTVGSLAVVSDGAGVRLGLFGNNHAPLGTLEVGRAGGKVPAGFYEIIKQWTRDKCMQFGTESERGTFAYFVARKIAREGTQRHRIPIDVYSTPARAARNAIESVLRRMVKVGVETSLKTAKTHF